MAIKAASPPRKAPKTAKLPWESLLVKLDDLDVLSDDEIEAVMSEAAARVSPKRRRRPTLHLFLRGTGSTPAMRCDT